MGGRAGGCYRTGKGAKGKRARLSTRQENGLRILMIKVFMTKPVFFVMENYMIVVIISFLFFGFRLK